MCRWKLIGWGLGIVVLLAVPARARAAALSPESPEVKAAVDKAIQFLEGESGADRRTGGKALIALAMLKYGADPEHPRIKEAVEAIRTALHGKETRNIGMDIYSTGLSIIFLVTLESGKYEPEISALLAYLQYAQKPHGGWGYPTGQHAESGDTSMTQYGVLSCWEATQAGFQVPRETVDKVTNWLIKTQDPQGGFGYQGIVAPSEERVKQQGVRHSMAAAGLGSVYICANLLGYSEKIERDEDLPRVLRLAKTKAPESEGPRSTVSQRRIREAQAAGNSWIQSNYKIDPSPWTFYYLYALERYWSFREAAEGERGSKWYNDGARYLIRNQRETGAWDEGREGTGAQIDTAFAVLFLLRSSKKSIEHAHYFRAGTSLGGRGLPKDTARVEVQMGRLVSRPPVRSPEALCAALADPTHSGHRLALETLRQLPLDELRPLVAAQRAELEALANGGTTEVRLAALDGLARSRQLDVAPLLIQALSDPDVEIVRQACRGLNLLSRRLDSVELPDRLAATDRQSLIDKWTKWYLAVRPDAELRN